MKKDIHWCYDSYLVNIADLISKYDNPDLYRKTVTMERHSFRLADLINIVRKEIYLRLAPIANTWMNELNIARQFANQLEEFQRFCRDDNQTQSTVPHLKIWKWRT